jgi:hypothetical protein
MTRSKKEKRANLKRKKERSHRMILNTLIIISRDIILKITTQNRNKTKKLGRKSKSQIKNESLNKKSIPEENKIKPEEIPKKK